MKIQVGKFEIYPLLDGYFLLDGGMMFRQAKTVWQELYRPDEQNRIKLAARCFLIKGKVLTLFDTGIGNPLDPMTPQIKGVPYADFYGIDQNGGNLLENLERDSFEKKDIRFVTQSHLHLDHAGWNTYTDMDSGKILPTFSKATYLAHEFEWKEAVNPHPLHKGSYRPETFLPLEKADPNFTLKYLWKVKGVNASGVRDNKFAIDGLLFLRTSGHTPGHWVVFIESEGKRALLAGDIIPTHKHIVPTNVMNYDLETKRVHREKVKLLNLAAREKWLILFDHDPDFVGGYVTKNQKGHFEFKPLEGGV